MRHPCGNSSSRFRLVSPFRGNHRPPATSGLGLLLRLITSSSIAHSRFLSPSVSTFAGLGGLLSGLVYILTFDPVTMPFSGCNCCTSPFISKLDTSVTIMSFSAPYCVSVALSLLIIGVNHTWQMTSALAFSSLDIRNPKWPGSGHHQS
jgi:hypothetical protein